ncbi:MAG: peptide/nickel transport system ATP-binding protein, partial [Planctomycetota bacterium]
MSTPLLEVKNLHKHFPIGSKGFSGQPKSYLHAVDGVSFNLHKGETLG